MKLIPLLRQHLLAKAFFLFSILCSQSICQAQAVNPKAAQAEPSARLLIERWTQALGGAERLRSVKRVQLKGTVKNAESTGDFAGLEASGKRSKFVIDFGIQKEEILVSDDEQSSQLNDHDEHDYPIGIENPIKNAQNVGIPESLDTKGQRSKSAISFGIENEKVFVSDGKQSWQINGRDSLIAYEDAFNNKFNLNDHMGLFSELTSGQLLKKAKYLGEDETHQYYKLQITVEGDRPYIYYLDKTSFLPVRRDDSLGTTSYSDWKEVKGIKFAFRQQSGINNLEFIIRELNLDNSADSTRFTKPTRNFRFEKEQSLLNIPSE